MKANRKAGYKRSVTASPIRATAAPAKVADGGQFVPRMLGNHAVDVLGRGGRPLSSGLRLELESRQRADFSGVRIHPNAPGVTAPLKARAVTRGRDIYFHPGQYRPDTPEGKSLIAHELAHTRQAQRPEKGAAGVDAVSKPGDRLERNADALAAGATSTVLPAPAGMALCSPFDNETADERSRRQALLTAIDNARDQLLRLLATRGLLDGVESQVERNGVRGIIYGAHTAGTADEEFVSYTARDARIRRIIRSLMAMGRLYRSAPVPADFAAPVQQQPQGEWESTVTYPANSTAAGGVSSYGGASREWVDLQAAYERYRITQNQTGAQFDSDWYYLTPNAVINVGAARGAPRLGRGIATGAYVVFPDIDGDPLNYMLVDGYTSIPRGASPIIELWHDDMGYYYTRHGRRIDVRSPWR